jgi:hypothetical protein
MPRVSPDLTLGWELEACRSASTVPAHVIQERDGSVTGDGTEYKIDATTALIPHESLRALRTLSLDPSLHVNRSCGFHVHVGLGGRVSAPKRKQWAAAFVLLARAVEPYAFNAVPPSRRTNHYCRAWRSDSGSVINRRYQSHKYANDSRYMWVNVVEAFRPSGIGTVEVRLLGSTKRYPYLFAWAAICHKMAAAALHLLADPSALPFETQLFKEDFRHIEVDILQVSSPHRAAETAALLGQQAGFLSREEMTAAVADMETMCAVRPTVDETADTRLTETQALQEAFTGAVALADADVRQRGRRRAVAAVAAVMASSTPDALPEGFNPDAFAVIPTNGGNA